MFAFILVFLFFICFIYIFLFIYFVFIYFLLLKLVGTQVEVYADCVFCVLTGQVDSSDHDDK